MKHAIQTCAAALLVTVSLTAHAGPQQAPPASAPPSAQRDCVVMAAEFHHVNADILRAILWGESGMKANAFNRNENGSVDVGIAQFNSSNFADLQRAGISPDMLYDPCVGTYVAAWHYSKQVKRLGNTWQAVGGYHSQTTILQQAYANSVAATLVKWKVLQPGFWPFPNAPRSSAEAVRLMKAGKAPSVQGQSQAPREASLIALTGE